MSKHRDFSEGATIVVAASDSLDKSGAKYICDGTADDVEIQAAIDELPAGGGKVLLLDGNFEVSTYISISSNTTLHIIGNVKLANGAEDNVFQNEHFETDGTDDTNITIIGDGGVIDGNKANQTSGGSGKPGHIHAAGFYGNAISLLGVTNSKITGISTKDAWAHGINLAACDNIQIFSIKDNGSNASGLHMHYRMTDNKVNKNIIVDTVFFIDGCNVAGATARLYISGFDNVILNNIFIKGSNNYGITIFNGDDSVGGLNLTANNMHILDSVSHSIIIRVGNDAGIGLANINLSNINIDTTGAVDNNQIGIRVSTSITTSINGLSISNCFCKTQDWCIYANKATGDITNVHIAGGKLQNTSAQAVIAFYGVTHFTIHDVIVTLAYAQGINIDANSSYGIIAESQIFNAGAGGTKKYGIEIDGTCDSIRVINCIISNRDGIVTQLYGVASGGTNVFVEGCDLRGNTTAPLVGSNMIYSNQHTDPYRNISNEVTNYIHAAIVGTGAEQEIIAAITNTDVPRNVSITTTAVGAPSGDVTIDGIDAKGNIINEYITISAGGTAYSNNAFSTVTKITIPATVPGTDSVSVGIGSKLGLSNIIYTTADVFKVRKNDVDWASANWTVDATYHTVDVSTGGAINIGDDFEIYYRSNLNIIG